MSQQILHPIIIQKYQDPTTNNTRINVTNGPLSFETTQGLDLCIDCKDDKIFSSEEIFEDKIFGVLQNFNEDIELIILDFETGIVSEPKTIKTGGRTVNRYNAL